MKFRGIFMGGIKDDQYVKKSKSSVVFFFRWFLLKKMKENNLISHYDRFIVTRSDFIYVLPHPKMELLDEDGIWIPNYEYYDGIPDRHAVLSKKNLEGYLNTITNMVLKSNIYFMEMNKYYCMGNEKALKIHLMQNNLIDNVKYFPYIMYSVRGEHDQTSWSVGIFSEQHCYYIKYSSEYEKSKEYEDLFNSSNVDIDEFYKRFI